MCGASWLKTIHRFTEGDEMNAVKMIAIVLIVAGTLALVYGGFSYTKNTTEVKLGPLELSIKDKETVNVPLWAGVGAIVAGAALLLLGNKK
jgi:multidrug transporter EmrE-like cation transporter